MGVVAILQCSEELWRRPSGGTMAEVLLEFSEPIADADGITYTARAWGAEGDNGLWEGWIEFQPHDGADAVRSGRETTQPNRVDTIYWATGLTPVYLEGALDRALKPIIPQPHRAASILNPFSAAKNGEAMFRRQLGALSSRHLVNIIVAHELSARDTLELNELTVPELIEVIVAGVYGRAEVNAE